MYYLYRPENERDYGQEGRRYTDLDNITKEALQTIQEADIRAGSLFDEEAPDDEPDEKHAPGNTS